MKANVAVITAIALFASAGSAQATTTNFICTAENSEAKSVFEVTTDDTKGEVTYKNLELDVVVKREAIFTADSVIWGSPLGQFASVQFTLSRIDLSFRVDVFINDKSIDPSVGYCKIIEAPKRHF